MSVDRPTFSENWHRVAELRPRLRAAVRSYRQHYRGRMWHVLADPVSNQFFRLDEPAYRFVALLDGRRTVSEAWRIVNEDMGDSAPTQGEAIQLLGQLYTANLVQAELPPDSEQMFARYRKRIRREVGGYFMNFLFARIPLIDPQPLLNATTQLVGWIFGPIGFLLWLAMLFTGIYFLAGRWDELLAAAEPQSLLVTENVVLLGLCFVVVKAIHELGHAYACAHFGRKNGTGGPVHTIGIMFMVLMPVPYVDASSSWTFRSKWHRAYVAAAGMYVELFVAAVAAVIWARTGDGTLIHDLAYNVVFIASISTLLFNGNPLLRFDGYYILSDLLEIANLAQRSKQYLYYLVKRYSFGVRPLRNPAHSVGERFWLAFYGVASFIYRIIISIAIFIYIFNIFPFIGALMGLAALAGWVIVPLGKFIKYLAIDGEVERVRGRATAVTVVWLLAIFAFIGTVPMPDRGRAEGVVEPVRMAIIHTGADGFVERALPSGSKAAPGGEPLLSAQNRELQAQHRQLLSERRMAAIRRDVAHREDPSAVGPYNEQVESLTRRLERIEEELAALSIRAPFEGVWVTDEAEHLGGVYVRRGQRVGLLADPRELIVRVTADQALGPRIDPEDTTVELRVRGRPTMHLVKGTIRRVLPAGQMQLPSAALGYVAGGSMRVDTQDQSGMQAAEPFFEVHIALDEKEASQLRAGQRVVARFEMPDQPLLLQWLRSVRQLIQQRFS